MINVISTGFGPDKHHFFFEELEAYVLNKRLRNLQGSRMMIMFSLFIFKPTTMMEIKTKDNMKM